MLLSMAAAEQANRLLIDAHRLLIDAAILLETVELLMVRRRGGHSGQPSRRATAQLNSAATC